jgi:hypothetical protein
MLIEKFFPLKSNTYLNLNKLFVKIGSKIDEIGLIQLFSLWTLTVAGVVFEMGLINRSVYWDWSNWKIGLSKLFFVTVVFILFLNPKGLWNIDSKRLSARSICIHMIIAFMCLLFGYSASLNNLIFLIPYLLAFYSGLLIFQFQIQLNTETKTWFSIDWENKIYILLTSFLSMLISVIIGIYLDDPILSTSAMVSTPFPLIALLWPDHVRHLQRARFYPLFIFSMFLCVRAPWFLIPLIMLFIFFRVVNYFRFGIAHPSFGVDFAEEK